jgi:broad specificity phosphatase PhoE
MRWPTLQKALLTLCIVTVCAHAAPPAEPPAIDGALVSQLRSGGFVIYLRHTGTNLPKIGDAAETAHDCTTQRVLSDKGRQQAKAIGAAFRALEIPVGQVLSSPACRTKQTAELAFGRHVVVPDLRLAIAAREERQRLGQVLRELLAVPPAKKTNTVIVSHSANLKEAMNLWPEEEGMAYIFRPLGNGKLSVVARATPEAWTYLVSRR